MSQNITMSFDTTILSAASKMDVIRGTTPDFNYIQ